MYLGVENTRGYTQVGLWGAQYTGRIQKETADVLNVVEEEHSKLLQGQTIISLL